MSIDLQGFAFETIAWTGALIALVLVLRRPVSRYFGAQAAYALWALPFLRLLMPPIVLPAEIAPPVSQLSTAAVPVALGPSAGVEVAGEIALMQPMVTSAPAIDWLLVGLVLWLVGTLTFLIVRYRNYFATRRDLLAGSSQVGTRGRVRLIETPATASPVAFGVFDKVVALPAGFMAQTDPVQRDLALEHELAHHRAHDLLANALSQPLFAMHWFNPLGWVGWRAMRRDQEAACDARVVARCDARLRASYAHTIASFVTGANGTAHYALAAPMACPVLGDKSIIHRLRSLTMSDHSPRRRLFGRALILCALAALPLTATISHAEAQTAELPPAPPSPPQAPAAPGAPAAPEAPDVETNVFVMPQGTTVGEEGERVVWVERKVVKDGSGKPVEQTRYTVNGREATAEERAEIEAKVLKLRKVEFDAEKLGDDLRIVVDLAGEESEFAVEMKALRERLGEKGELAQEMKVLRERLGENGEFHKEMRVALAKANAEMPEFRFECDGSDRTVRETTNANGKKVMVICRTAQLASARSAIANARRAVEREKGLSERERAEALRSLDQAMQEIAREN